ncbi:MAG: PatB family C-S lyase [Proteobacteria bacterium]|nr:PatB family C-S lyase [Pseudomonadota bacterium]MDA1332093.1 PatB family C-S lyase [Pseudomonadota bacterium]
MTFEFDKIINRTDTFSTKWNKYDRPDIIPMWVADMDFETAPCIKSALMERVNHGIYGYTQPPAELPPTVAAYLKTEFNWAIDTDWIIWLPSLVVGLNVVSRAFAEEGDEILSNTPIYPPFLSAPNYGNRKTITAPLAWSGTKWVMDFDALKKTVTHNTKAFLFCSPHNPTGRVWDIEELNKLVAFCHKHNLTLISDEIHASLILDQDKTHTVTANLPEAADISVTLLSASKTFNIPGLGCAYAVVKDPTLRNKLKKVMNGIVHHVGALGYTATLAAYKEGKPWQAALVNYLRLNRDHVEANLSTHDQLTVYHSEATYLTWIDARRMNVDNPSTYFEQFGIGIYDGAPFGAPGFLRLNFACPRSVLSEALKRITKGIEALT